MEGLQLPGFDILRSLWRGGEASPFRRQRNGAELAKKASTRMSLRHALFASLALCFGLSASLLAAELALRSLDTRGPTLARVFT